VDYRWSCLASHVQTCPEYYTKKRKERWSVFSNLLKNAGCTFDYFTAGCTLVASHLYSQYFIQTLSKTTSFIKPEGVSNTKNKFLMVQLRSCDCYIWMHFVTLHWVSVTFGCCNSWLFYISSVDFSCPKVCPRLSKNSTYVMICLNMLHKYVFGVAVVIFH
jgi:hypothetical protein